ncbi:MAG: tetratricopeptide repeat protein [Acidobacteria bacterium]|nr:tetratricopeptide repeat protein [Acidobacteriota bacterium]
MNVKQVAICSIALALVIGASGCGFLNTVKAKDHLNRAAQAYNAGDYDTALGLLKQALELDPNLPQLKPYYGATLYAKYNLSGEEQYVQEALKVYQEIYQQESQNPNPDEKTLSNSVAYIAVIYDNLGDKDKKREWMLKRLDLPGMTPVDKAEVYYGLGTGYWQDSFEITQKYIINKPPEPEYQVPEEEAVKVREFANKGLEYINQALSLNPEYGDALTYKNLLLRELAKVEKDPKAKKQLLEQADAARNKALEILKRKQEQEQQQGGTSQPQ